MFFPHRENILFRFMHFIIKLIFPPLLLFLMKYLNICQYMKFNENFTSLEFI